MNRDDTSIMIAVGGPQATIELAHVADGAGIRRVWLAETAALDVAAVGGAIARETALEIGTAIVPVYSRSPAVLAMMAATWARLGGGDRPVHLGIGAGGQAIVERWHGVPFERSLTTVRDTIAILRQALAGERTAHEGAMRRSDGFRLGGGAAPSVRLYVGGMGPKMRRLAATAADGLIVTWVSPRVVAELAGELEQAVADAGRPRSAVRLVARAYVAVVDDPDAVREAVRREVVEYIVSPPYARYFTSVGFGEEVEAVAAAFAQGDREGTARAVSDRLLGEMLIAGEPEAVCARLQAYLDAGADEVLIQPVAQERAGDPARTVREVAARLG